MDLLAAEIARKRKISQDIRSSINISSSGIIGTSKYLRQSELQDIQQNQIYESQKEYQKLKDEKNNYKKENNTDKLNIIDLKKNVNINKVITNINDDNEEKVKLEINLANVIFRLRKFAQPITLFGETTKERITRLLLVESIQKDNEVDDFRLDANSGHNSRNIFLGNQGKNNKEDEDDDDEDDDDDDNNNNNNNKNNTTVGNKLEKKEVVLYSLLSNLSDEKIVLKYFKSLLKAWEYNLNKRTDVEKLTAKGKIDTKTQKQCKDYIRPLFKLCKKCQVPLDILNKLKYIVKFCEEGNFKAAHDEYLKAAIGNSAWPIGLTMVGIHERSGREKISSSKVAHAMNNELQRKYLTSVKRLMTFAQNQRPDVAPSMKVN